MLPKQKHTFVIFFPWSAFWLMFCQFHAFGSLHSNCQRHKAGGSGGWRMSDVTEGWMKKETVYVWYVLLGFQALQVMLLVLSMYYFLYSLPEMRMRSHSFNKACLNIMLCMKFLRKQHRLVCERLAENAVLLSQALADSPSTLFFHNAITSLCLVV